MLSNTFQGGVAVITGSGSGIGEALALRAAECGMSVVVAEISHERGEHVVAQIKERGGEAIFVHTDVSKRDSVKALAEQAFARYGKVNLLINNAGIATFDNIWSVSDDTWDRAIDVNLRGVVAGIQYFTPRMLESQEETYICNLGSLASFSIGGDQAPYFSCKHAVLALSECLHVEMTQQQNPVNVSVAVPGIITTQIFKDAQGSANTDLSNELRNSLQAVGENLGMPPKDAAQIILDGIAAKQFIVSTHPKATDFLAKERADFYSGIHTNTPSTPSSMDFLSE